MSSNSSSSLSIPQPPPGTIWVAELGPALSFLMIGSSMGSILVTMLFALFFFSTPSLRKKPIFVLNVLALLFGISSAIIIIYGVSRSLLYPDETVSPHADLAMGAFEGLTPIVVGSILLVRLSAVYPYSRTPLSKFLIIMGVSILVKITRIVNAAIFLHDYARTAQSNSGVSSASVLITTKLPCIKIEWTLQVVDDAWSSVIFITRVYKSSSYRTGTNQSVSQRIKGLFWISVSNFVFPLILGIVQLVLYLSRPDDYLTALYIEVANLHVIVIGVVFATVWMAEGNWASSRGISPDSIPNLTPIAFAKPLTQNKTLSKGSVEVAHPVEVNISQSTTLSATEFYHSRSTSHAEGELRNAV